MDVYEINVGTILSYLQGTSLKEFHNLPQQGTHILVSNKTFHMQIVFTLVAAGAFLEAETPNDC